MARGSQAISPTAHYTGEVWRRAGLSHPALATPQGRALHAVVQPIMAVSSAFGGDTLEAFLLARHRLIDRLLESDIEAGRIGQVIEIAAGMSPRGLRLTEKYPELTYLEADLPAMAARKREALAAVGARHSIADLDALEDAGPQSLAALAAGLDPGQGLAIVTEGLLNYFPREQTNGIWRRISEALAGFPQGLYVSDVHLGSENRGGVQRAFGAALGVFVRGRIYFPYADEPDALAALQRAGFTDAELHPGSEGGSETGVDRVHVIEARRGT